MGRGRAWQGARTHVGAEELLGLGVTRESLLLRAGFLLAELAPGRGHAQRRDTRGRDPRQRLQLQGRRAREDEESEKCARKTHVVGDLNFLEHETRLAVKADGPGG